MENGRWQCECNATVSSMKLQPFILICFALSCFVLFCFVLFCFVLFCFVLFCFVLFCFVLFCFVLFCFDLSQVFVLLINIFPLLLFFFSFLCTGIRCGAYSLNQTLWCVAV